MSENFWGVTDQYLPVSDDVYIAAVIADNFLGQWLKDNGSLSSIYRDYGYYISYLGNFELDF